MEWVRIAHTMEEAARVRRVEPGGADPKPPKERPCSRRRERVFARPA